MNIFIRKDMKNKLVIIYFFRYVWQNVKAKE